ncbi:MAG: ChaN family lipoprotein [Accumulibacter sp.]|jgi:uncharacterized iron-regulated protein
MDQGKPMTRHGSRWLLLCSLLVVAAALGLALLPPGSAARSAACAAPVGWLRIAGENGESIPANEVLARAAAADVVLLGEQHDDEDHHRWQLQVLAGLHALRPQMIVGFEMFPRRVQPVLDRWVAGELSAPALLAQTGWEEIWSFPAAFYLPLFEFVRINRLPMLALNVDARLTRAIGDQGWDAVPESEREGVGRAAPASSAYRDFLFSVYREHAHGQGGRDSRGFRHFVEAQLNWDRAMAEALAVRLASGQGDGRPPLVVGVIGSGHLRHGHGVPHQLRALGVGRVVTLLPLAFAEACREMQAGLADALFVLPSKPALPVPPPRLGVQLEDIAGAGSAVRVQAVTAGSLAEKSGLMAGDRLLEVAGRPAGKAAAVIALVRAAAPGTWLPLRVGRGDATLDIVVRLPPE